MRDPAAPGREYALHATDEAMTEFALLPYAADAPLHVTGVVTHTAKYATYANWRPNTLEPLARSEEAELYDHTSRDGMLEIANLAGRSRAEHRLRATLERAIRDELHEPLPATLVDAHRGGVAEYHRLAAAQETISERQRLRELMKVVEQLQHLV